MIGSGKPATWTLTLAGLIPFVGGAAGMWQYKGEDPLLYARVGYGLVLYSAVILSFLGGIRWGRALGEDGARGIVLFLAVVPSLAAWGLAFASFGLLEWWVFAGFAGLFALQFLWDWISVGPKGLPLWFLTTRQVATVGAAGSCLAAAFIAG